MNEDVRATAKRLVAGHISSTSVSSKVLALLDTIDERVSAKANPSDNIDFVLGEIWAMHKEEDEAIGKIAGYVRAYFLASISAWTMEGLLSDCARLGVVNVMPILRDKALFHALNLDLNG